MEILTTNPEFVPTAPAANPELSEADAPDRWLDSMRRAIRSVSELRHLLGLPAAIGDRESSFPLFVTREFASRIEPGNPTDPLLLQVLPTAAENLHIPGFVSDPVGDLPASAAPGLLCKYERRALVITTGVCAIHCRYCFRREFDYSAAASSSDGWQTWIDQLQQNPEIDEVILSGGDPLTLTDSKFFRLVHAIESVAHVKRLRIHSRMPIVLPDRITRQWIERLRQSRLVPWMVVHCNHSREIDHSVANAIAQIIDAGIPVLNQAVLLKGVNDNVAVLEELCRRLIDLRVQPYYLHQLDRVQGAAHFAVPQATGRQLVVQLRERLPGYAVPTYVAEQAGKPSKTPL